VLGVLTERKTQDFETFKNFHVWIQNLSTNFEPTSFEEATYHDEWKEAM
jgi:hypothetical protein